LNDSSPDFSIAFFKEQLNNFSKLIKLQRYKDKFGRLNKKVIYVFLKQLIMSHKPTKVGGIVLDAKQHLLVVQGKYSGKWSVPKGTLEDEEGYLEGALREIREETGLKLQPCDTDRLEYWGVNRARLYLLQVDKDRPRLRPKDDGEIAKAYWLDLSNLEELEIIKDNANKMLLAVIRKLSINLEFDFGRNMF
jgi:8-oxo-dGTP pyrophosphatase MutT (NUDIX family)